MKLYHPIFYFFFFALPTFLFAQNSDADPKPVERAAIGSYDKVNDQKDLEEKPVEHAAVVLYDKVYDQEDLEEKPTFPGCESTLEEKERFNCAQLKMLQFVYSNVRYPPQARQRSTEGMVVIGFTIGADGLVKDPTVVQSIGDGCDEESMRVVNEMPRWNPGKVGGVAVASHFKLPVRFKLE